MGDAVANPVWRGALAFLAVFYTGTFGLSALAAGVLLLMVRLSDGMDQATIADAPDGMRALMNWIPSGFSFLAGFLMLSYPLSDRKLEQVELEFSERRKQAAPDKA